MALSSLMEPAEGDRRRNPEYYERLADLRVDYAVLDGDLELVCVIILDAENPDIQAAARNAVMDRCLKSATIKAMRWSSSNKPSVEQISRTIMPMTNSAKPTLETISTMNSGNGNASTGNPSTMNPDTVQRIHKADPVPSNIRGLTNEQLDTLTPNKVLSTNYPHIWQRICLFAPEPKHLQKYLLSLSIQDRGEKRAGFPIEALKEIADISTENDRFMLNPITGWQPSFINR